VEHLKLLLTKNQLVDFITNCEETLITKLTLTTNEINRLTLYLKEHESKKSKQVNYSQIDYSQINYSAYLQNTLQVQIKKGLDYLRFIREHLPQGPQEIELDELNKLSNLGKEEQKG
jgi:hypothetical protein